MSIKTILARLLPKRWQQAINHQASPSVVLLLREANSPKETVLRLAAERAWGISFAGGEDCPHFIMQSGNATVIKAGPYMFHVISSSKPYFERDPRKHAESLPQASQRIAWSQHAAWLAIDCINGSPDVELEYCVLAKLAAEMLNANCTGVYVPAQASFIPNEESLYAELQKMAASRDSGIY